MAVVAVKEYVGIPKDVQENYHGNQILFIGWEDHLMFCSPFAFSLSPSMTFQAILDQVLPGAIGAHPDFAKVDWAKVEWLKSGQPWKPDYSKTLVENGLRHKDAIRFRTPGLTGIKGSGS